MNINKNIDKIPAPAIILKRLIAYAKIDVIMNPNDEDVYLRKYHYDKELLPQGHFLKIDDSGGDHYYVIFSQAGCIVKGFDHECDLSPYNYDEVYEPMPKEISEHDFYAKTPVELSVLLDDVALEKELVTFCMWQSADDTEWHYTPFDIPDEWFDGIDTFISLTPDFDKYIERTNEYYEIDLDTDIVKAIYEGNEITATMIEKINPAGDIAKILKRLSQF
ncbi:hypothetical protein LQZ18_01165 [Lachnospiraceae bacterium ZAX-1]